MNILAIDPGLSAGTNKKPHGTGIAVFENNVIKSTFFIRGLSPDHTFKRRMDEVVNTLTATIPDWARYQIVIERSGYQNNINVAYQHYGFCAVIDWVLGPVHFMSPTTVKKLVAGHGHADKDVIKQVLQKLYVHEELFHRVKWDFDDTVDAVAVGLAYIRQEEKK